MQPNPRAETSRDQFQRNRPQWWIALGCTWAALSEDKAMRTVSSNSRTLIGKCLCGAVQVAIADKFCYAGYCHCPDCRASSGSAFSAFAGIRKEKLQLTCGEENISKFRKNEDNVIHFCRRCGSWLFSIVRNAEFAHVRLGILIDDPSIRPTFHIFVGSKAPWETICDGLAQFVGLPEDPPA
jgi:hypothetical protein